MLIKAAFLLQNAVDIPGSMQYSNDFNASGNNTIEYEILLKPRHMPLPHCGEPRVMYLPHFAHLWHIQQRPKTVMCCVKEANTDFGAALLSKIDSLLIYIPLSLRSEP